MPELRANIHIQLGYPLFTMNLRVNPAVETHRRRARSLDVPQPEMRPLHTGRHSSPHHAAWTSPYRTEPPLHTGRHSSPRRMDIALSYRKTIYIHTMELIGSHPFADLHLYNVASPRWTHLTRLGYFARLFGMIAYPESP